MKSSRDKKGHIVSKNIDLMMNDQREHNIANMNYKSSEGHSCSQTTANGEHSSKFTGCSSQDPEPMGSNAANLEKSYRKEIIRVTQSFKNQSSIISFNQQNNGSVEMR